MATTLPCCGTITAYVSCCEPFLLSHSNPPIILKKFFENELAEAYLLHLHSTMSMFHANIREIDKERSSVPEVWNVLQTVSELLQQRIKEGFLSLKTQKILRKVEEGGLEKEADSSVKEACSMYKMCFKYLLKWTVSFNEFYSFRWVNFNVALSFSDVQSTIKHPQDQDVIVDDAIRFHQFCASVQNEDFKIAL
jgi:hypothetical protein